MAKNEELVRQAEERRKEAEEMRKEAEEKDNEALRKKQEREKQTHLEEVKSAHYQVCYICSYVHTMCWHIILKYQKVHRAPSPPLPALQMKLRQQMPRPPSVESHRSSATLSVSDTHAHNYILLHRPTIMAMLGFLFSYGHIFKKINTFYKLTSLLWPLTVSRHV